MQRATVVAGAVALLLVGHLGSQFIFCGTHKEAAADAKQEPENKVSLKHEFETWVFPVEADTAVGLPNWPRKRWGRLSSAFKPLMRSRNRMSFFRVGWFQ